jgi:hypothetical protein
LRRVLPELPMDPMLASLRGDPRFTRFIERNG